MLNQFWMIMNIKLEKEIKMLNKRFLLLLLLLLLQLVVLLLL